jgi:hypothetical protein
MAFLRELSTGIFLFLRVILNLELALSDINNQKGKSDSLQRIFYNLVI